MQRLLDVSDRFADGDVHLTTRANLQLRGLPGVDGQLTPSALAAIEATGLIPSRTHELVRNILVSPQTGLAGGRADLRDVALRLDAGLCADAKLARLPGRFLFTLDDGRGDLVDRLTASGRRGADLGLVALSGDEMQLRVGDQWGEVVGLDDVAAHVLDLAAAFLHARGIQLDAPWHLRELAAPLRAPVPVDPRLPVSSPPLSYGAVPGGTHVHVPDGVLTAEQATAFTANPYVVVTPWHGILVPSAQEATR